ncbi:MAG: CotH kinase family protein [Paludibacteraceae bacterium]|nr:CotH kinase family protein [Paludibacteraceae bacterium]
MRHFLLLTAACLYSTILNAAVSITEVMPCNLSTQMDDAHNFSGYVEFFNDSDEDVSLDSCTLVHYKLKKTGEYAEKWSWMINQDFVVEANSYKLMWMDELKKANHAPYKLDSDGGYLILYTKDDTLADSLAFGKMDAHYAFGKWADATGYMEPSPLAANTKAYAELSKTYRCTKPSVNVTPGIAKEPFGLVLSTTTEGADIYYTLDGTEPNLNNGIKFEDTIHIEKNANIRARAYKKDFLPSKPMSASYIFMEEERESCGGFQLPVVSITVDPIYFFDDSLGIYVTGKNGIKGEKDCVSSKANYNQDWKRPISFEYIVDGQRVIVQELEANIEGGCSRIEKVKSLSMKASSKTGDKDIDYHFFKSKPDMKHQTIYLRNGGTAYEKVRFRDGLMQTFATTMNIDYQACQPVAFYLNGEYQGLMSLNERTNADYLKANYGVDEDNIDLVTLSDQLGIRASKGDLDAYYELVVFLTEEEPEDSSFYIGACERMDMDEYIDYQVFQQFIGNTDWPGNNTKIWRERKEGSKFRWILYDTDFGFGMPNYGASKVTTNMFNWCKGEGFRAWGNSLSWMTDIFASLSLNKEFRRAFVNKYKEHLETTFSTPNIEAVFDSITTMVDAEYCTTFSKSAITDAASMRAFALKRGENILGQIDKYAGNIDDVKEPSSNVGLTFFYYMPKEDKLSIITEENIEYVEIFDMSGKSLSKETIGNTYYAHNMSKYGKGIFVLNVHFKEGVITKKILID